MEKNRAEKLSSSISKIIEALKPITHHFENFSSRRNLLSLCNEVSNRLRKIRLECESNEEVILHQEIEYQKLRTRSVDLMYKLLLKLISLGVTIEEFYFILNSPTSMMEGAIRTAVSTYQDQNRLPSNIAINDLVIHIDNMEVIEAKVQQELTINLIQERNCIDKYL